MPAMRKVMGDQALRSNYDLMVAEMQASPADLSPFNSRLKNTRASLLLINKSLNMSGARQIFSIGANGWRGYQVGDPAAIPVRVRLLLFDAQDHKLELLLSGPKSGGVGVWNQEAINALVASIRPPN